MVFKIRLIDRYVLQENNYRKQYCRKEEYFVKKVFAVNGNVVNKDVEMQK